MTPDFPLLKDVKELGHLLESIPFTLHLLHLCGLRILVFRPITMKKTNWVVQKYFNTEDFRLARTFFQLKSLLILFIL